MANRDPQGGGTGGDLQPAKHESYGYPPAVQLPDPVIGQFADPDHATDLTGYLRILRKHKGTVLVFAFLGALAGLIVLLPQPPIYRASAAVEVQPPNDDFPFARDINPNASQNGMYPEYDMATQVKVLQTGLLLDRVIAKLDRDETLRIQPPEDRLAAWRKALHLPASQAPTRAEMIAAAAASLRVSVSRTTRIIEISGDSWDPKLAAAFANAMATEYIEQTLDTRWETTKHAGEWLTRQLDDMKTKLEKSEDELQSYAASANLEFTGDKEKENVAESKLHQLQAELSTAQADRVSRQAKYELAKSGRLESLGQVLDDGTLRSYDVKLADLRRELAELTSTLTPEHYKVKRVQAQIAEMEADRKKLRDRIVERISNDFQEAQSRENLLAAEYQAQYAFLSGEATKVTHYGILQREVETNRQLYESLLQKVKEAGISAALRASNIQVIDPAKPPETPYGPRLQLGSMWGLFAGLILGFAIVVVREKLNRTLEAPGEAAMYLNVSELGVIPSRSIDRSAGGRLRKKSWPASIVGKGGDSELMGFQRNRSLMAESFRVILTSILYAGRRTPAQVIVVSSPGASEGKTTVLCNLAMAYAETSRSVLIVDCDMRRPRLHDVFGLSNDVGLAGLLSETTPLEARSVFLHSHQTAVPGVTVLTSGEPSAGTANLLHSRRFAELIELARQQFDVVLLDTPPMLHIADARIAGVLADGVVLVVRSGKTSRESALAVKRQLVEDGIPIIGAALNDWNPKVSGTYGYEAYSKYYASYYTKAE
jgi:capsular exopolysaccharide synthesis family protein